MPGGAAAGPSSPASVVTADTRSEDPLRGPAQQLRPARRQPERWVGQPAAGLGTRDRLAPVRLARRIADALPTAALTIYPEAGHMLPVERTAGVATALRSHIAALERVQQQ